MLIEVKVPDLAESVPDATLLEWCRQAGDAVTRGEHLLDLETDKVTLEIAAPETGVLREICKTTGTVVVAGEVLAVIDTEGGTQTGGTVPTVQAGATGTGAGAPRKYGPAVRKLLDEHQLDAARIEPGGRDGRLTKADVIAHLERRETGFAAPASSAPPAAGDRAAGAPQEKRVAMTRLRRRTAERLLAAQRDNALLTTFNEANMQPVMDLRRKYQDEFERRHGVRLGLLGFFVKAAVAALESFAVLNASVDGSDIVYHDAIDIGVAVSTERGLVVPILRDVTSLSFADIERRIRDFGERARDGRLAIEELTGGTFTITNGGIFGSLLSTPIVNPPQSAILGMHRIQDRPVAENGQVVVRPMMYLALTYDHRIIDGREAVQFLVAIKQFVEDPARLLLKV